MTVVKPGYNEDADQGFSNRERKRGPEARNVFQMKEDCLSHMFDVFLKEIIKDDF